MEVWLSRVNFISLIVATFIVIVIVGGTVWRAFKALEPYLVKFIDNVSNKLDDVVKATENNTCSLRDSAYETKIARQKADKEREEIRKIQTENIKILEKTIQETNKIKERQGKDFEKLQDHEDRIGTLEGRKQLERDRKELEEERKRFIEKGECK